jgi:hypothetical protein
MKTTTMNLSNFNLSFIFSVLFISSTTSLANGDVSTKPATDPSVPQVNVSYWNKKSMIQNNNNCYNYSTNRITNDFAQPGDASNNIFTDLTCEDVAKSASSDLGVEPTEFFEMKSANEDTLIALVVAPDSDFHWYRRDNNNLWSHKPGSSEATIYDNNKKIITSPELAHRGPYSDFCGYFKIKNYPKKSNDQNTGHVRIGNMKKLPQESKGILSETNQSYIILNKYSGRPNPKIRLSTVLQKLPQLQIKSALFKTASTESLHKNHTPRLGEETLVLDDPEGLLAPKNAVLPIDQILTIEEIQTLKKLFLEL